MSERSTAVGPGDPDSVKNTGSTAVERADAAPVDRVHEVRLALSRLSAEMSRREDSRRYGVNCALRVIDDMSRGDSVDVAIERLLPGYSS